MTIAEIEKIITKHNHYASNLMNTDNLTPTNTVFAYKKYIDETPVIAEVLKDIVDASKTAEELFIKDSYSVSIRTTTNEIDMMAMYYKHLGEMAKEEFDLPHYAFWIYRRKSFNENIGKLLEATVHPLIQYIEIKLKEMYIDIQEQEKANTLPIIHVGDNYTDSIVQKDIEGKSVIKKSGNNKNNKHFNFQKGSFFLGVLSAVVSGLIVWGITELIKYLIGG